MRILKDTVIYTAARATPAVCGLAVALLQANFATAETYGSIALVSAVQNIVVGLCGAWLCQSILRYYHLWIHSPAVAAAAIFRASVGCSLLAGCATVACVCVEGRLQSKLTILSGASAAMQCFAYTISSIGQAALVPRVIFYIELVRGTSWLFCIWAFASSNRLTESTMMMSQFVGALLAALEAWRSFLKWRTNSTLPRTPAESTMSIIPMALRYGWPLSVWIAINSLFVYVDRGMVAGAIGLAASGVLSAAYDIVFRGASFLFQPGLAAIHPMIMKTVSSGKSDGRHLIAVTVGLMTGVFAIALAATLVLILQFDTWLPHSLKTAENLILPLLFGSYLTNIAMVAHKPLEIRSETKFMLAAIITAIIIKILVGMATIQHLGPVAAPASTIVAMIVYIFVCVARGYRGAPVIK